jgi:hypothetical protein
MAYSRVTFTFTLPSRQGPVANTTLYVTPATIQALSNPLVSSIQSLVCSCSRREQGHVADVELTGTACRFIEHLTVPQLVMKFFAFCGTPKVHDRVHNSLLPVPVLSQKNHVLKLPSSLFNIMLILYPIYA